MTERDEWTALEQNIAAGLRAQSPQWTPQCLEPDDHLEVIDRGLEHASVRRHTTHLTGCAFCRREHLELRQALVDAERLRAAPEQAPAAGSTRGRVAPWWKRFLFPAAGVTFGAATAALALLAFAVAPLRTRVATLRAETETARQQQLSAQTRLAQSEQRRALQAQAAAKDKRELLRELTAVKRAAAAARDLPGVDPTLRPPETLMAKLQSDKSATMGAPQAPKSGLDLRPADTLVRTLSPSLRWSGMKGATSYKVFLYSPERKTEKGQSSGSLTSTEWTPQPLQPGTLYRWSVTARNDEKVLATALAEFVVIDQKTQERLQALSRAHLRLGDFYLQMRLLDDAEREYRTLAPDDPEFPTAQKQLARIKELRSGPQ